VSTSFCVAGEIFEGVFLFSSRKSKSIRFGATAGVCANETPAASMNNKIRGHLFID
jgi:hypothetical protein